MRFALLLLALSWVPAALQAPKESPSWLPGPFLKASEPIMRPEMDRQNVPNPAVLSVDGRYEMLYDSAGLMFHASSEDGQRFTSDPEPIFGPTQWYEAAGVEDPRLVFINNLYYLTYTGYEGNIAHLCLATSPDLKGWKKHGPMFAQFPANARRRYPDNWTRAGAILPEKVKGRWLMIFGDSDLWLATSDDLLNWNYRPQPLLSPERGQDHLEAGPPILRRKEGLVVLYNVTDENKRTSMQAALLADYDPTQVLEKTALPLLEPTQKWEQNVTSGSALLYDGHYWSLYYAGGDRTIGLARAGR